MTIHVKIKVFVFILMTMVILHVPYYHPTIHYSLAFQETKQSRKLFITSSTSSSLVVQSRSEKSSSTRRLLLSTSFITSIISPLSIFFTFSDDACFSATLATTKNDATSAKFYELPNSGGVMSLDLRLGTGFAPIDGDQVTIHYYGRLAAKQGWRFDSTYDHKDSTGEPIPFVFILGSNKVIKVISGIEAAVRSMKVGGVRRVIIPPSQGYQNTTQEPLPPNVFDRQRLFTTIFNPTRLANGEGSMLGTLIFDIELVNIRN